MPALAGPEDGRHPRVGVDAGRRGDVAGAAKVLGERGAHDGLDEEVGRGAFTPRASSGAYSTARRRGSGGNAGPGIAGRDSRPRQWAPRLSRRSRAAAATSRAATERQAGPMIAGLDRSRPRGAADRLRSAGRPRRPHIPRAQVRQNARRGRSGAAIAGRVAKYRRGRRRGGGAAGAGAEHGRLQQGVRRQAVGAVHAGRRALADREEARHGVRPSRSVATPPMW